MIQMEFHDGKMKWMRLIMADENKNKNNDW